MGQQLCKPVSECGSCDYIVVPEFFRSRSTVDRQSLAKVGVDVPLLSDSIRLVTECKPPEALKAYDLLLVNQVSGICGQLSDGDLVPFNRSKIACEYLDDAHLVSLDTTKLHDEVVAVCIMVRFDPQIVVASCSVVVESPDISENLAEYKIPLSSTESAVEGGSDVFLAMVHTSNINKSQAPMWYFKAVNQELSVYEQNRVGLIAGKAVEGKEYEPEVVSVKRGTRSNYRPSEQDTDRATVYGSKSADQGRSPSNLVDPNTHETTRSVLHQHPPSETRWGLKFPELRVPGLFSGRSSQQSQQRISNEIKPEEPRNIIAHMPVSKDPAMYMSSLNASARDTAASRPEKESPQAATAGSPLLLYRNPSYEQTTVGVSPAQKLVSPSVSPDPSPHQRSVSVELNFE